MNKSCIRYTLIYFLISSSSSMAAKYVETFQIDNEDVYPEFRTGMSLTQNIKDIVINLAQTKTGSTSELIHNTSDLEAQYFIVENQYKETRSCFKVEINQGDLFNNNKEKLPEITSLDLIGQAKIDPSQISALHLITETSRTYVYRSKSKDGKEDLLVKVFIPKEGHVRIKYYKAKTLKNSKATKINLPYIAGAQKGKTLKQAFKKMYQDQKTVHVLNYDNKDTSLKVGAVEFSNLNNKKIEVAKLTHENLDAKIRYDESLNLSYDINAQKELKIKSTKIKARASYDHLGKLDYTVKASDHISIANQKIDANIEITPEIIRSKIAHKYYTSKAVYRTNESSIDMEQELSLPTNTKFKHKVTAINSGSKQSYEVEQKIWYSDRAELKANQKIKEIIGSTNSMEYKTKLNLSLADSSYTMSGEYTKSRGFGVDRKSYGLSANKTFKSSGVIIGIKVARNEFLGMPDDLEAMATISIPLY